MPLYDLSIESLDGLPDLRNVTVLSDCDNTLFDPETGELYDDARKFLDQCGRVALVSANPDKQLLEHRRQMVGAEVACNQDSGRSAWNKARIFHTAITNLDLRQGEQALVVGDRAVADIWVGKRVARSAGLHAFGVRVQRPSITSFGRADDAIRLGYDFCRGTLERAGQAQRFRPPENSPRALARFVDGRTS